MARRVVRNEGADPLPPPPPHTLSEPSLPLDFAEMRSAGTLGGRAAAAAGRLAAPASRRSMATTVGEMAQPGMAQTRTVTVLPGHGCVDAATVLAPVCI